MTISLIIAITNALSALAAYATGHQIWCGFNITMVIVFSLSAMACEGRNLNRIKKLEEEIDILKRR